MKKRSRKRGRKELQELAAMPDGRIDTSDIPELTEEQLRRAMRGRMYRPVKRAVTMRLDVDVIAWPKQGGRAIRPRQMRFCARRWKKGPRRANGASVRGRHSG